MYVLAQKNAQHIHLVCWGMFATIRDAQIAADEVKGITGREYVVRAHREAR